MFVDVFSVSVWIFQGTHTPAFSAGNGDGEIRTLDPLLARQVLSQLSYTPMWKLSLPGRRQNFFSHFRFEGTGFAPSKLNNDYAANPD